MTTASLERGAASSARARIESVDALRGIVMVLMALDHVRDYFGDLGASPTNLDSTTAALFLTRWITYFCAPVFFLLTGTGAYLALRRLSRNELARFLFTRGLWLIVLEFGFVRFAWQFNFDYRVTLLTVMWALGWSMIFLAMLVHLRAMTVTAIGVAMIAGHNLLDGIDANAFGAWRSLWSVLHAPGFLVYSERVAVFAAYSLIPWIGVTAAGYGLGQVFAWDRARRRSFLVWLGAALCAGFIMLRAIGFYGDPAPWSFQDSALFTALSFINTTKYPPSLLYLMMTLGPALLVLRALDGTIPRTLRPVLVIGKVPLFYYVLHIMLIHALAVVASFLRFGEASWMFQSPDVSRFPVTQPAGWPLDLPAVYLVWIAVVLLLYLPCRWYAMLKRRRNDWWLSYL